METKSPQEILYELASSLNSSLNQVIDQISGCHPVIASAFLTLQTDLNMGLATATSEMVSNNYCTHIRRLAHLYKKSPEQLDGFDEDAGTSGRSVYIDPEINRFLSHYRPKSFSQPELEKGFVIRPWNDFSEDWLAPELVLQFSEWKGTISSIHFSHYRFFNQYDLNWEVYRISCSIFTEALETWINDQIKERVEFKVPSKETEFNRILNAIVTLESTVEVTDLTGLPSYELPYDAQHFIQTGTLGIETSEQYERKYAAKSYSRTEVPEPASFNVLSLSRYSDTSGKEETLLACNVSHASNKLWFVKEDDQWRCDIDVSLLNPYCLEDIANQLELLIKLKDQRRLTVEE